MRASWWQEVTEAVVGVVSFQAVQGGLHIGARYIGLDLCTTLRNLKLNSQVGIRK